MEIVKRYSDISTLGRKMVGGKAWAIARMGKVGLPVPLGFSITTELLRSLCGKSGPVSHEHAKYVQTIKFKAWP